MALPVLIKKLSAWLLALWVAACAAVLPREHLIPKAQLTDSIERLFPLYREKGSGVFRIMLNRPELRMLPEQDRVSFACDFTANSTLGATLQGHLESSAALHYDAKRRAVYLQQAHFDDLQFKQAGAMADMVRPLLNLVVNEFLKSHPIYQVKPEDLRVVGVELEITGLKVDEAGLRLQIRPVQQGGQ